MAPKNNVAISDVDSISNRSDGWSLEYGDNFKGVPQKRSCTDLYCLFVLGFFVAFWVLIGYYAYENGDLSRLSVPRDSSGRMCGRDLDVADKKFLLFYDLSKCASLSVFVFGCQTKQICVKQCPDENWFSVDYIQNAPKVWKIVQDKLICNNSFVARTVNSVERLKDVIKNEECAPYYVRSTSVLFRLCLPDPQGIDSAARTTETIELTESFRVQNAFSSIYKTSNLVLQDLYKCWHFVAYFVLTSMVVCLFTILIMGTVTRIIVWFILVFVLLVLFYSSFITFVKYQSMDDHAASANGAAEFYSATLYGQYQWLIEQKQTWMVLFVVSTVLFIVFTLLVIFLRSRIGLAVMLIGEGSKAINSMKSTLCFPLLSRIVQLSVLVWFIMVFLYVTSLGNSQYTVQGLISDTDCRCAHYKENDWCLPEQFKEDCQRISRPGPCLASCSFKEFHPPRMKTYFHLYNLFGLFWAVYFLSGFGRLVLSYCFATWYWTYHKTDLPFFILVRSTCTTIRYHLGTVAVGSFLIATCGFVRTLLEYIQRLLRQSDGLFAQCIMWSFKCFFWLLQKFLIFISHNAYIMCAIMGRSFFPSAEDAFGLLARNILRAVVLDKVLDFLILIGKIAITSLMVIISYFTFHAPSLNLNYPLVPVVLVGIVAWLIASSFFGVYTVAVDTLFLSFLKDGEINDGSQSKPYYMSRRLKYILRKKFQSDSTKR